MKINVSTLPGRVLSHLNARVLRGFHLNIFQKWGHGQLMYNFHSVGKLRQNASSERFLH